MLENIDSTGVFGFFEQISRIPRGSGNNTQISNYFVQFAKEHNLSYIQDEHENVIIYKSASKGYENKPTVILQGHMDMVCEKSSKSSHDFRKEPLELQVEGDFIFAKDTTLGADDGIALAYALAILADDMLVHPPLEVVITTDEETGMNGALGLDTGKLKGSYLINLDSEEEGVLLTGCAGGMSVNARFPFNLVKKEGYAVTICVSGLKGGHSGTEIDKNRENAVLLLGRVLLELKDAGVCFYLGQIQGGEKDNVIPNEAQVTIVVKDLEKTEEVLQQVFASMEMELRQCEPDIQLSFSKEEKKLRAVSEEIFTKQMLLFLEQVPYGVQKMSASIPGLVESSINLGICRTDSDSIYFSFSIRSSLQSYKKYIGKKVRDLVEYLGGSYRFESEYPAWEYRPESQLREWMTEVFMKQYGKKPKVEAIHAGLECGILSGKMKDLDIISIGPDVFDIHTVHERLSISSTQRVYQYLLAVLRKVCD